ncbi:ATP-binding cassette domain-containing protein [Candidatus Pelagibacter communis]|uniref:ATP-binding cassette domain-containing protein n=1 Tax=Candidatus Pelagibacter TaxID=198251 RepID=UPI003EE05474
MSNIKKFRIKYFKNEDVILNFKNVSLRYDKKIILDNFNLKLNNGQILGLLGPNGVGKTTIFNLITGLIKPQFGSISINNTVVNDIPIYLRTLKFRVGFVPQYGGFFGNMTLIENLKAIAEIAIRNRKLRDEKINFLMSKFELDSIRDIKSHLLSGGQKKRLVIALSLISNPKILLLDEPFAALDVLTIKMLQEIIVDLQTNHKISVILCDHQARDLLACVDNAVIINNGKVIAEGTPTNLINNIEARNTYFGESFKFN